MTNENYRFVVLAAVERLRARAAGLSGADAYEEGRQMAYYECLQAILDSAETVGLTAAEVGMDGFSPGALVGLAT
jgi:hypothetical protein